MIHITKTINENLTFMPQPLYLSVIAAFKPGAGFQQIFIFMKLLSF